MNPSPLRTVQVAVAALACPMKTPDSWTLERSHEALLHVAPVEDTRQAFAASVAAGLSARPRRFEARFLYDAAGSEFYERITEQPEYYPTGAEAALLAEHAEDIRRRVGGVTLVELGSGSSMKTRHLLDTGFERYVPIDISASALRSASGALAQAYPHLQIEALATTYEEGLTHVRRFHPGMIAFFGSSLGNLSKSQTDAFLAKVADALEGGGSFLLGVDLVKDVARLEAAYNDAAGWSAKFTLNMLDRINRELEGRIPAGAAEHLAFYNTDLDRIEIYAQFAEEVHIDVLGERFTIAKGERVQTEISRKYRVEELAATARRFGLELARSYSDGDVALLLFRRV